MPIDTEKPRLATNSTVIPRLLVILLLAGALASCTSTDTKHEEVCDEYTMADLQGEYTNVASETPNKQELLLADLLWPDDWYEEREIHASIDRIAISLGEDGALEGMGYAGTDVVKSGPAHESYRMDGNVLNVYSGFSVFPSEGGVVVGPFSIKTRLFLNCEGNLILHTHQSGFGLVYLLIPVAGSVDLYAIFERVGE